MLPDDPKDCRGDFAPPWATAKILGLSEIRRHRAHTVLADEEALSWNHNAHDWIQVGLKQRAEVSLIKISTKWYTGNQVRAVSVFLKDDVTRQRKRVLDRQPLNPDAEHEFPIEPTVATECLIECYFDGGISRINFFGALVDPAPERRNLLEGARISHVSNQHYGKPDTAVTGVRGQMHMVGWESARTGFGEQALFQLRERSTIDEFVVDTYLHRLNPPLTAHVYAVNGTDADESDEVRAALEAVIRQEGNHTRTISAPICSSRNTWRKKALAATAPISRSSCTCRRAVRGSSAAPLRAAQPRHLSPLPRPEEDRADHASAVHALPERRDPRPQGVWDRAANLNHAIL